MGLYRWMHKVVLTDKRFFSQEEAPGQPKRKKKNPLWPKARKSFSALPELGLIAILIMAYGVSINLVEVQWKNQLGLYSQGDKGYYNWFMGQFSTVTGIFTILFGLFVGSNILRRVSWFTAAVITPIAIGVGGFLFFSFIVVEDIVDFVLNTFSKDAVTAAALLGAGIVIVGKAVKYILFDSTKEMAYIPLPDELKTKGKAAVDVIGGRAGKAGGAFAQSSLQIFYATKDVTLIAVPAFALFGATVVFWFFAVKLLSKKVDAAIERKKEMQQATAT